MSKTAKLFIVLLIAANCKAVVNQTKAQPTETPRFFYKGLLISDCTIPGEGKKDNVQPSNAICWQLSKTRYIWVYVTTSFQGSDSVRAIVYQIRKDTPDGKVLNEGIFSPFTNQWDPFNKGDKYFRQQGHNKVFGVPKGAVDKNGKLLPSNNVFVASWYQCARIVDHNTGKLGNANTPEYKALGYATWHIVSIQFKLNDAEDNIEFLTPITVLKQKGYENKDVFCELGNAVKITQHWYVPFKPYNEECTQWVDYWHFCEWFSTDDGGIAAVMMEFNPKTGLYEWVKTGPLTRLEKRVLTECSLCKVGDEWVIAARPCHWFKTKDLFAKLGTPTVTSIGPHANQSAYIFGDGVLRVFGGSQNLSPFKWVRNPQYCWDVDPNTFALSNCKTVLSTDDIGMIGDKSPKFRTFLSPVFQNRQIATMTVSREIVGRPKELDTFGVHYWYVTYDKDIKDEWTFAK